MKSCIMPLAVCSVALASGAPALAQGKDPPGVNPTHYQCYKVDAPSKQITLKVLRDQFGIASPVTVTTPMFLCSPTAKNGVAPKDPKTHYLCYQDDGIKPANRSAQIINQFGTIKLKVMTPAMLCVPSLKKLVD